MFDFVSDGFTDFCVQFGYSDHFLALSVRLRPVD